MMMDRVGGGLPDELLHRHAELPRDRPEVFELRLGIFHVECCHGQQDTAEVPEPQSSQVREVSLGTLGGGGGSAAHQRHASRGRSRHSLDERITRTRTPNADRHTDGLAVLCLDRIAGTACPTAKCPAHRILGTHRSAAGAHSRIGARMRSVDVRFVGLLEQPGREVTGPLHGPGAQSGRLRRQGRRRRRLRRRSVLGACRLVCGPAPEVSEGGARSARTRGRSCRADLVTGPVDRHSTGGG